MLRPFHFSRPGKSPTFADFRAGLVQSAFYLGYFLLALPAGMFTRRFGFKGAVILGLLLYACGAFLFWPAAELRTYGLFLLALFVLASGLAFLLGLMAIRPTMRRGLTLRRIGLHLVRNSVHFVGQIIWVLAVTLLPSISNASERTSPTTACLAAVYALTYA